MPPRSRPPAPPVDPLGDECARIVAQCNVIVSMAKAVRADALGDRFSQARITILKMDRAAKQMADTCASLCANRVSQDVG